ncbi:MAG: peptidoglycan DD-metalloendopeptidase family protein [Nitrospirae bacterium]|nr:peptidoglycan DD-metalloendopeptidase family protein [Nitrospirota bacterium]
MKIDPQTSLTLLGEKLKGESQNSSLQGLQRLKNGLSPPGPGDQPPVDPAQARKAAENFESYFLFYVLKGMREAFTDGDPLLEGEDGGGFQGSVFKEMMDEELGKTMAQNGGVGLADMVLKQLGVPSDRNLVSPSRAGATVVRSPSSATGLQKENREGLRLNRPVPGAITSSFGTRADPFTGRAEKHEGVDLRASEGDDVRSAAAGIVVFSGEKPGYGRVVEVLHADGYSTIYAHLKQPLVERGDFISRGGLVGRAGETGRATGPHVHLELKKDGEPINPEPYLLEA